MHPYKVLVTGASGFIGGRVVERLAIERFDCVRTSSTSGRAPPGSRSFRLILLPATL